MAQATKLTNSEIERRRAAASRLRGLFADVAPNESLVDELIADRRAEAQAEAREGKADRRAPPAVTADREWANADVAAEIQLIR